LEDEPTRVEKEGGSRKFFGVVKWSLGVKKSFMGSGGEEVPQKLRIF